MSKLFSEPRLYRNMNHASYVPNNDTQFDESVIDNETDENSPKNQQKQKEKKTKQKKGVEKESTPDSPKAKRRGSQDTMSKKSVVDAEDEQMDTEEKQADEFRNERKKKEKKEKKSNKEKTREAEGEEEPKEGKSKKTSPSNTSKETKVSPRDNKSTPSSPAGDPASEPSSPTAAGAESGATATASENVFSQLLLESILEQKSVADFIGGMPDKRGTLLIRFPTTIMSKSWKKRYFTLHGDCLYFHEDQHVIHPSGTSLGTMASGNQAPGITSSQIPYKDCKKIEIANFYVIQQDQASAAATAATSSGSSSKASSGSSSQSEGGKVYGGGKPIIPDETDTSNSSGGVKVIGKSSNKFEEIFSKNTKGGGSGSASNSPKGKKDANVGSNITVKKDSSKDKDSGPVVRGRRRSSLVNEKGSVVILLMPKDKKVDPIELTGINEGSISDLAILNEWVLAINARICLLNFLSSPMTLTAMARGGREILAFLTDANSKEIRIQNKFTDLGTVLTHFKDSLAHRSSTSTDKSGLRIIFKNCAMTDSACLALSEILKENESMCIELLDLSNNVLTKTSMLGLHEALCKNKNIKELRLDSNQLGDEGLDLLVNGNADGLDEITPIWSHDSSLTSFSCRSNQISDSGFEKFLTGIMDYLKQREQQEKEQEEELDEEDVRNAEKDPTTPSSPHTLPFTLFDFGGNLITDLGLQVLSAFLVRNPSLQELNLDHCFLTDTGIACLKDILQDDKTRQIRSINLASNQITSLGVDFIVQALAGSSKIERKQLNIDLSGNEVGTDGVAKLLTLKSQGVPAAHFTSFAFSLYDPDVIQSRLNASGGQVLTSPRSSPQPVSVRQSPPAVAVISTSQQGVLDLFSPIVTSGNNGQMTYPAGAAVQSNAKVSPANHSMLDLFGLRQGSSTTTVASATTTTTPTTAPLPVVAHHQPAAQVSPHRKRKKDKKARENDASAPKIAIGAAPSGPRVSVAPLHPPPAFSEPVGSPEAPIATPNSVPVVGPQLPSPASTTIQIGPGVTPVTYDSDEPEALLPSRIGDRKPKGMNVN